MNSFHGLKAVVRNPSVKNYLYTPATWDNLVSELIDCFSNLSVNKKNDVCVAIFSTFCEQTRNPNIPSKNTQLFENIQESMRWAHSPDALRHFSRGDFAVGEGSSGISELEAAQANQRIDALQYRILESVGLPTVLIGTSIWQPRHHAYFEPQLQQNHNR